MIEIKVERKPLNGNFGYLIKDFKALSINELPREYFSEAPYLWTLNGQDLRIKPEKTSELPLDLVKKLTENGYFILHINTWVSKQSWELICELASKAGERLAKIMYEIKRIERLDKALAENWNGTKVYKW